MNKLTRAEQETVALWDREERTWRVHTEVPAHERKLKRLGWAFNKVSREWSAPNGSVTFRKASRVRKPSSVGSSKARMANLAKARKRQKGAK